MQKSFGKRGQTNFQGTAPRQSNQIATEREGGKLKSFAFACITGFTFSIIVFGLLFGTNAPSFFSGQLFLNVVSVFALIWIAPVLLIVSRVLADVFRLLRIPRGYSDVSIGIIIGSMMFIPDFSGSEPIEWRKVAFLLGGAIGGFTYWRSRGYPGMQSKHVKTVDTGYKLMKKNIG
ncbi:hypothetical protein [Roseibium sp.]|uniref:hypothetical protein n=1 Tax=Roseibium sp. TaxID=1936156 RepID=UPI003BAB7482